MSSCYCHGLLPRLRFLDVPFSSDWVFESAGGELHVCYDVMPKPFEPFQDFYLGEVP